MKFVLYESFQSVEKLNEVLINITSLIAQGETSGIEPDWEVIKEASDTNKHNFSFIGYKCIIAKSAVEAEEKLHATFIDIPEVDEVWKVMLESTEEIESDCGFDDGDLRYCMMFICDLVIEANDKDIAIKRLYEILDEQIGLTVDDLRYNETGEDLEYEN
jgi:hypothetical protein